MTCNFLVPLELSGNTYVVVVVFVVKWCPTLCNPMQCSTPGSSVLHCLLEFAQIHVHCIGDTIQPSHSLLPLFLPSVFPSIRVFSIELALCIGWPKYWSTRFSNSSFNEYSGLIQLCNNVLIKRANMDLILVYC